MSRTPRWPLLLIAAPAAVAIWSGWVGLGELSGFGVVHPLPGIVPGLRIDTALTLPLGIESYAALALGAWLRHGADGSARRFARSSALGALMLGMAGQVSYHLLAARHATRAPALVVVLVACLPVVVLGCAVALLHLLSAAGPQAEDRTGKLADLAAQLADALTALAAEVRVPLDIAPDMPADRSGTGRRAARRTGSTGTRGPVRRQLADRSGKRQPGRSANRSGDEDAEREFAAEIAAGHVPSLYEIRGRLHVGLPRAKALRQHIARQALAT